MKNELEKGREFERLSYLSLNQLSKKDPSHRDGYQALEVDYEISYNDCNYPIRLIFIKSDGKIKRDQKARSKHIVRTQTELEELANKVGQPYYRNMKKLEAKVENILHQNKTNEFFHPEFTKDKGGNLKLCYSLDTKRVEEARLLDGIYVIGTTLSREEYPMDKAFTLFKEQHLVESANKNLKSHIKLRPIFLQSQQRIESLLFVLFLALMVYMLIERIYRMNVTDSGKKRTTTRTLINAFRYYCLTIVKQDDKTISIPNTFTPFQMEVFQTPGIVPLGSGP